MEYPNENSLIDLIGLLLVIATVLTMNIDRYEARPEQQQSCRIPILVKTTPGITYVVYVTTNDTINSIKIRIHDKESIPLELQRLNLGCKQLEDNKTLSYYSIQSYSTLQLTTRLRGGVQTTVNTSPTTIPTTHRRYQPKQHQITM